LQEVLGHSSIVVTQRYARLSEDHVRAEAAKVAERLGWGKVGEESGRDGVVGSPAWV